MALFVLFRLGDGASGANFVVTSHALKKSETVKQQNNKQQATNKQTSKQANKQTSKQANKQTSKQANKQTSKPANQQTNKPTNQTNQQTNNNNTVDIPVRALGGTGGRLQGFLPGQFSSSFVEQIADIPQFLIMVFLEGFQGFHPGQSTAASSEQLVDIPVPHGGLHLQDPGLASLPHEVPGEAFQGVFSTFFRRKKCEDWSALGVRNCSPSRSHPRGQLAHSDQFWEDESVCTWMLLPSGRWYLLCSDPEVFLGWPGMMGMENGMGEAASRGPVASVVLASAYSLWSTLHTVTTAAPSLCVSLRLLLKEFPVL